MSTYLNYNARSFPSPDGSFVLLAVLRQGVDGLRCYAGIVKDPYPDGDPNYAAAIEWVSSFGYKLSPEEARKNFPFGIPDDAKFAR